MKLYKLIQNLLSAIEETLHTNPTADELAASLYISSIHLQRLFKATYGMTLASYIRSRRLADSLEELLGSKHSIVDIAIGHGFNHAQSYTRAFKKEYGITPGELRKNGHAVKIKPPLQLLPTNELASGILFGPEMVYVNGFNCVGKRHIIHRSDGAHLPAKVARDFWLHEKSKIPNMLNSDVYIGLTKIPAEYSGYTYYTPSICVQDLSDIPDGFEGNTVKACLCAQFRYIGEHHPMQIDADVANDMYLAIKAYEASDTKYGLYRDGIYFERIPVSEYDGKYCKMEWYSPVYEK